MVIKQKKTIRPVSICWQLTSRCNYSCPFCFKHSDKHELYYNEAEIILKKIAQSGIKKVSFSGGEPLLWPGLENIIKKAKSLGLVTMLITNGSLVDDKFLQRLNGHLDWLTLPIDGSNRQIQNKVGRPPTHLPKVLQILKFIEKEKLAYQIKINTVLCRQNLDDVPDIASIIKQHHVDRWKVFQFFPIRDAALLNKDKFSISQEKLSKAKQKSLAIIKDSPCSVYFASARTMERSYFIIAPNGTVFVSRDKNDYFLGNLLEKNIKEIWQNSLIDKKSYWDRASWILQYIKNTIK